MKIPEGYQHVMPYLILNGAEKFLQFMKDIFGAKEKAIYKRENESGIMHGELTIGDSTIMFADATSEYPPMSAGLYIHVKDVDQTYRKALEKGATSVLEPADKEYGRSGGIKDPWGNTWWITSVN